MINQMYLSHDSNKNNGLCSVPHIPLHKAPKITFFKVVVGRGRYSGWPHNRSFLCVSLTHL